MASMHLQGIFVQRDNDSSMQSHVMLSEAKHLFAAHRSAIVMLSEAKHLQGISDSQ